MLRKWPLSQHYKRKYCTRMTQMITKSEVEGINFILLLLLQEGGRMGQEDNFNHHHWDLTPEREPKVCHLCSCKRCLSRAIRSETRGQESLNLQKSWCGARSIAYCQDKRPESSSESANTFLSRIVLFYFMLLLII